MRAALAVVALLLVVPATAAAAPANPGPILYVGDSLGVGTFPQLRAMMPGASLEGDTRVGRTSREGLSVLRSRLHRRHRVVILDLGTNDWSVPTLTRNLRRARWQTGDLPLVVFTLNKPGAGPFNRAVTAFAGAAANVVLIDWHSAATGQGLLGGDGIHASAYGYRRRAALVAVQLRALGRHAAR